MAKSKQKKSRPKGKRAVNGSGEVLERIATALERLAPRDAHQTDFTAADAFAWHPEGRRLVPVPHVNRVEMSLL